MCSWLIKKFTLAGFILILFAITIAVSVSLGSKSISYMTVWESLFDYDAQNMDHLIIHTSRFPRVLGALLIGGFLAVSGA